MKALRILLVEDDAMIGMFLRMALENIGYDVCAVESTEEGAVAAAARFQPDLMIVDTGLSSGDGVSAVERVLRASPVRYLFASGDPSRARARWPDAPVIQKPFYEADLAHAVLEVMKAKPPP